MIATLLCDCTCPLSGKTLLAGTVCKVARVGPAGFVTVKYDGCYYQLPVGDVLFE